MSSTTASFSAQLDRFVSRCKRGEEALFRRVSEHVGQSIMYGSSVTGAPGQPVKTGRLLRSWRMRGSVAARRVYWYSHRCPYAGIIEDNLRGAKLRSSVGGFHSVKLTTRGFRAIVRVEMGELKSEFATQDVGGRLHSSATGRFVSPSGFGR